MDRFAVGTGRCGSTLLTRMLSRHRDLLGLNEVFTGLDWGLRFSSEPTTGSQVADILNTPNRVVEMVTARGHTAEEVSYPFRPTDRYKRGDPIPWILTSTLGHLSSDPDAHWARLSEWLSPRGPAPIATHYRALFDHLANESGKSAWVERSGSSTDYVGELLGCFGEAPDSDGAKIPVRVVHIHRNGPEVALSMRNHSFYRLAVQLQYALMPEGIDPGDEDAVVDAWLDHEPPLDLYGKYWSDQLAHAESSLAALDHQQLLTISFEDLVTDPAPNAQRLADFLGLENDPKFVSRATALVRGMPRLRATELSSQVRRALVEACAPGVETLRRLRIAENPD